MTSADRASGDVPDAVLIVCTRSRAHLFEQHLLGSLAGAAGEHRVVVVDQSTDDATERLLRGMPGVVHTTSGPGLSHGRNVGVSSTTEAIVAFSDDDVTLPPGWLDGVVRAFGGDDEVGVVLGRASTPGGELMPGATAGEYRWPTNPFGLGSGFNMAFRRAALERAGSFDEDLGAGTPIGAAEDSDMIYRVMRAGYSARCVDDIAVIHHDWRSAREEVALHFRYGQGVGAMTAKHARGGDRRALTIALKTVYDQLFWFGVHLVRGRWAVAARHPAYLVGVGVGALRWLRLRRRGS